jgi:hypothetical protein
MPTIRALQQPRTLANLCHQRIHRRLTLAIGALILGLTRCALALRLNLSRCLLQSPLGDDAFATLGAYQIMTDTSRWIQQRWPRQCQDAALYFNAAAQGIGEEKLRSVSGEAGEPLRSYLADELGFNVWRPPVAKRRLRLGFGVRLRDWRRFLRALRQ